MMLHSEGKTSEFIEKANMLFNRHFVNIRNRYGKLLHPWQKDKGNYVAPGTHNPPSGPAMAYNNVESLFIVTLMIIYQGRVTRDSVVKEVFVEEQGAERGALVQEGPAA